MFQMREGKSKCLLRAMPWAKLFVYETSDSTQESTEGGKKTQPQRSHDLPKESIFNYKKELSSFCLAGTGDRRTTGGPWSSVFAWSLFSASSVKCELHPPKFGGGYSIQGQLRE